MSGFEYATRFFHACESVKGCKKVWNTPWAMRELGWVS